MRGSIDWMCRRESTAGPEGWACATPEPAATRKRVRAVHPAKKRGFETRFIKMNPINEFTLNKLQKLGPIGCVFKRVNFRKVPLVLQTNLYAIAHKIKD